MKEQVQETGIRKWFGDDFPNMQAELYAAILGIIEDYGSCVLSGANITESEGVYSLSAGIAYLKDSTGANGKMCRIYAQTDFALANFPLYIVQASRDRTTIPAYGREYKDAITKNIIVEYYGKIETTQPAHANYLTITSAGVVTRLRNAIQSVDYRFVTDSLINTWNAKLAASSYTAADVLSKLLGVDGTGSGLDADKLDGNEAAAFVLASAYTAADVLAKLLTVDTNTSGLNANTLQGYTAQQFIDMLGTGVIADADTLDGYHAAAFVLASAYTAADVLAKLLGVDGTGSGLDADLLDGNHAAAFATAAQGTKADAALPSASYTAADILTKIKTVDGTGSGLDADTLDGNHATAFATSAQGTKADNAQVASDCVSTNTANKVVKRDASGNFVAGTITVTDIIIS